MKILLESSVFNSEFTGVAKSTFSLLNSFRSIRDMELDCFNLEKKTNLNIKHNNLSFSLNSKYSFVNSWKFNQHTKSKIYDLIYFPSSHIPNIKIRNSSSIGLMIHDVLPLQIPNYFNSYFKEKKYTNIMKRSLEQADYLFTVSHFSRKSIIELFGIKKEIVVISNSSSLQKPDEILLKKKKYFLYFGGYHMRKGFEDMLKSFFLFRESYDKSFKLLIIGKEYFVSKETDELIAKGRNDGSVIQMGYVDDVMLSNLLLQSQGLIYLSKYEGFGMPPLEAMTFGCPVITVSYTSIPEVCGDSVIYVDPQDYYEVAKKMFELVNDNVFSSKLIFKGTERSKLFNSENSAKIFLKHTNKKNEYNC